MGTTTADIIYYPKNEIHIPNRRSLGILRDTVPSSPSIGSNVGNFVFYKPKKHNEDLKIVLPSSFSNLGEVKVVSFADPTGVKFTLKPLEVATFTEANDFSYPSKVSVSSIYNTGAEEGLEINNVLHKTLAYDYKIG